MFFGTAPWLCFLPGHTAEGHLPTVAEGRPGPGTGFAKDAGGGARSFWEEGVKSLCPSCPIPPLQ